MVGSGAGGPAGRINRRFLLLALVSAGLSALLVYVAISRQGGGESAPSTTTESVVVATVDIPARTQITEDMVELREVPEEVVSASSITSIDSAVEKVTRYPISVDEQLTSLKVVSVDGGLETDALAFVIPKGKRAISISADQVLSAGGLVLPGDYVDIIAVFDVKSPEGEEAEGWLVRTVLQNVEVLAVDQTIADVPPSEEDEEEDGSEDTSSAQRARGSEADPNPEAVTMTLLVSPEDAELLFLAEANGTLRAIVRAFGDSEVEEVRPIVESELWPAGMPFPASTAPR